MLLVLSAVVIVLFPVGAGWAWRRRGVRGLLLLTLASASAIAVLALVMASEQAGNRLARTQGYIPTAIRTLLFAGFAWIVPVIASAMSVWATAPRLAPRVVYLIAAATALIGTIVGGIAAIYGLWS